MTVGANSDAKPKLPVIGNVAFAPVREELARREPKHRMVIVCCGCGQQIDLPAVAELVQAETTPQQIVYRAGCRYCGFEHRIRVSQ